MYGLLSEMEEKGGSGDPRRIDSNSKGAQNHSVYESIYLSERKKNIRNIMDATVHHSDPKIREQGCGGPSANWAQNEMVIHPTSHTVKVTAAGELLHTSSTT